MKTIISHVNKEYCLFISRYYGLNSCRPGCFYLFTCALKRTDLLPALLETGLTNRQASVPNKLPRCIPKAIGKGDLN